MSDSVMSLLAEYMKNNARALYIYYKDLNNQADATFPTFFLFLTPVYKIVIWWFSCPTPFFWANFLPYNDNLYTFAAPNNSVW